MKEGLARTTSHIPATDALARAVEIAAGRVGAGTDDFFGEKA